MAFQISNEQRQSARFDRQFLVTDHEDDNFSEPFDGHDVNLTGLSFWVDNPDWFIPGQEISVRIKNLETGEEYCLDGVEVIHLQSQNNRILCGCHITHVSSAQLLAHHRTVVIDQQSADFSSQESSLDDFDFDEEGATNSDDLGDFQELVMVTLLQYEQLKNDSKELKRLQIELQNSLVSYSDETLSNSWLIEQLSRIEQTTDRVFRKQLSWSLFAKLLAYTPNNKKDRQAWQTMIADFEDQHLSEKQQMAFDFMHQDMSAQKAHALAREYMKAENDTQLELEMPGEDTRH